MLSRTSAIRRKTAKVLLSASVVVATLPVFAASQWCAGTLSGSYVQNNGELYFYGSWRGSWTQVCKLGATWKNVTAETCKSWHEMIQAAVVSQTPVTTYYSDAPACNELPNYSSAPGPSYFMLSNQ